MRSRCCLVCLFVSLCMVSVSHAASTDDMVRVPAGSFMMGHVSEWMENSQPVHKVHVDAFLIDKYEVTQRAYIALMKENPSDTKRGLRKDDVNTPVGKDYPVTRVSWFDAVRYCNARSAAEGLQQCYDVSTWECDFGKNGYRLPTEAEWEYACRAGTSTRYFYGNDVNDLINHANYWSDGGEYREAMIETGKWNRPLPELLPVGQKKPNPWGLYDMLGNAREWCNDWYDRDYYKNSVPNNPYGPEVGGMKVVRGGSYRDVFVICGDRGSNYPSGKRSLNALVGFRCVRNAEETKGETKRQIKGGQ